MPNVCNGEIPWHGTTEEIRASLELANKGLLPIGETSDGVDVVTLYRALNAGEISPEEITSIYQVNKQ